MRERQDFVDLMLEGKKTYPIENKLRTLCKISQYLVWGLFDCDRKVRDDAIYAGVGTDDWDDDNDSRVDEDQ